MRNRGFYIFILSMMIVTLGCSGKETKSQDAADETVNTAATEETGETEEAEKQKVIDEEGYLTLKDESTLLLKGMVTTYDAKTADESTIDGITAPWYRIALNDLDGESITQYWWVFGGYLEDYDENRNSEYTKTLFNTALEKGFIVIDEEE